MHDFVWNDKNMWGQAESVWMNMLSVQTFQKESDGGHTAWIEPPRFSQAHYPEWMIREGKQIGLFCKGTNTIKIRRCLGTDRLPWTLLYYSGAKNVIFELLFPLKLSLAPSYILLEAFILFRDWGQNNSEIMNYFFPASPEIPWLFCHCRGNDLLKGGPSNAEDK